MHKVHPPIHTLIFFNHLPGPDMVIFQVSVNICALQTEDAVGNIPHDA